MVRSRSKYERGKQAESPEKAGSWTKGTLPERHTGIVKKMRRTIQELDAYVARFGQAISACGYSDLLCKYVEMLNSLQPTDPSWNAYLKAVRDTYYDLEDVAYQMGQWKKMLRPEKRMMSDKTRELCDKFNAREERVVFLTGQHKKGYDSAQEWINELGKLDADNKRDVLGNLQEKGESMRSSAKRIRSQLHDGIKDLVTDELVRRLTELEQSGEG